MTHSAKEEHNQFHILSKRNTINFIFCKRGTQSIPHHAKRRNTINSTSCQRGTQSIQHPTYEEHNQFNIHPAREEQPITTASDIKQHKRGKSRGQLFPSSHQAVLNNVTKKSESRRTITVKTQQKHRLGTVSNKLMGA